MSVGVERKEICRLCLDKNVSLISVFDSFPNEIGNFPLKNKISVVLSIEVTKEDKFTTKICHGCCQKVVSFYNFHRKAGESQKLLAQWELELEEEINAAKNQPVEKVDKFVTSVLESSATSGRQEKEDQGHGQTTQHNSENPCDNAVATDYVDVLMTPDTSTIDTSLIDGLDQNKRMDAYSLKSFEDNKMDSDCLTCGDCDIEFKTHFMMKKHVKEKHSSYTCRCGAKFTCLRYLTRHEARHKAKATIPCKFCQKLFINNSELKEHQKSHQVGEKITCRLCNYVTLYKSNMSRHLKRHNKDYTLFCEICNEGCYTKDELATHNIKKHGAEPFYCKICNKTFTSKGYLYEHNKTAHWITTRDYLCETCGKAFKTRSATKRHMKIHLGLKFVCHICSKSVNSIYSLKKHLKVHKGIKDVICDVCGKAFVDKKYMAAHLRSHTGERPYSCTECGKRFTQATTLKVHMRYHTGERPYVCDICGAAFVTNTLLTSHNKNHSKTLNHNFSVPIE